MMVVTTLGAMFWGDDTVLIEDGGRDWSSSAIRGNLEGLDAITGLQLIRTANHKAKGDEIK